MARSGSTRRTPDFDFVDPQLAYRTDDWSMIYTTSMPLVGFQEKSGAAGAQLVPIGGDGVPDGVEGNGKTYTFHIRPGLKFSDGSAVTAASYPAVVGADPEPEDGLAARRQPVAAG